MNKKLLEANERIDDCKKQIKKFVNYRDRWWNPFTYFLFSKYQCNRFIDSYKDALRINIVIKRIMINRQANGDI